MALNSPVADLFRIEKSDGWSAVRESVSRLRQSLPPTEADLRQAFETWLKKVVMPRLGLSQEEVSAAAPREEVDTMLAEKIDRWNRELREKAFQEGFQMGLQEAFQEEIQKGRQEGEAQLLLRLLRLKFGSLEPETEERVRTADADQILQWGERVLTVASLQEVFRD